MSPEHCDAQLKRLHSLRGLPEDIEEYFGALSDIPELVFTAAIDHALRTRAWFPAPAELRHDCDAAALQFQTREPEPPRIEEEVGGGRTVTIANPFGGAPLVIHVTRTWKIDCDDCADSGWRSKQCPSDHCGRRFDHAPHEWVEPCQCREWNPTLRRRRAAQGAKYAQPAEKVA